MVGEYDLIGGSAWIPRSHFTVATTQAIPRGQNNSPGIGRDTWCRAGYRRAATEVYQTASQRAQLRIFQSLMRKKGMGENPHHAAIRVDTTMGARYIAGSQVT